MLNQPCFISLCVYLNTCSDIIALEIVEIFQLLPRQQLLKSVGTCDEINVSIFQYYKLFFQYRTQTWMDILCQSHRHNVNWSTVGRIGLLTVSDTYVQVRLKYQYTWELQFKKGQVYGEPMNQFTFSKLILNDTRTVHHIQTTSWRHFSIAVLCMIQVFKYTTLANYIYMSRIFRYFAVLYRTRCTVHVYSLCGAKASRKYYFSTLVYLKGRNC